mmetsp:Transcript_70197/g.198108  ORF Transcript_70197/g.198108 Transcript_70197/m.198108 type:complete len:1103 (-) Transcript_70197:287-3595(-)
MISEGSASSANRRPQNQVATRSTVRSVGHVAKSCLHNELESVFLVTALVRVRHQVQCILKRARLVTKLNIQLHVHRGFCDGDALDRYECTLRTAHHKPPAFLLLFCIEGGANWSEGCIILHCITPQTNDNTCTSTGTERLCVLHLVLERDHREAVARARDVHDLRLREVLEELLLGVLLEVHDVEDVLDLHGLRLLVQRRAEVRQLHEGARVDRRGLDDHLRELHGEEGGGEPAARGDHVDEALEEPDGVLQDEALVRGEVRRDRGAVEVRVQQELGLRVRVVQLVLLHPHAQGLGEAAERRLLPGADGHRVELRGRAEDVHEPAPLRALGDAPGEGLDGRVPDVVVRRDEPQVRRRQLHVALDAAAAEALEALDGVLDDLGEVVAEVLVGHALEPVVVRVLGEPPVVEGPGQPVHGVLLVLDGLHHDLRVHVVRHALVQVALDGERLVDELLVVLLLRVLRQQHAHARLVDPGPARAAHHLQHVVDGVVHVAVLAAVELLRVHDDHEVRQHRHPPAQLLRGHDDLDRARLEEPLYHGPLGGAEPLVEEAHAVLEGLLEGLLARSCEVRPHRLVGHVQEALGLVIRGGVQKQVYRRHAGLLPVGHEDDERLVRRVVLDGLVHGPAHGQEAGGAVVDVEALNHHLQRHGPDVRREVEEAGVAGPDPLAHVLGVRERRGERDYPDGLLDLGRDIAHAADDGLEGRPDVAVQEVQLVHDEDPHLLHALPRLPPPAHEVPLLRGRDDDVRLLEDLHVAGCLSHQLGHLETKSLPELVRPLIEPLLGCRGVRRNIHTALHGVGLIHEHPQHGKLGADGFPARRRRADEAVVVRGVEGAEGLRLDRVEDFESLRCVQLLGVGVPQRREGERLEVEQLGVRWVPLRQDEVPEGHRQQGLRIDPAVGYHPDEVLRRQGLRDRDREVARVLLLRAALLQDEHLLVEDLLPVHVLYENPEGLGAAVDTLVPLEVWRDGQLDHQARPRDRLHIRAEVELRKLVDKLVDRLPHLRESYELSDVGAREVVVALPREVLLLDLVQDLFVQTLEVPQWCLRAPHPLVDHLAPIERPQRQCGPAAPQANLKDCTHDPPCRLLHIHHVGEQCETVEFQL